MNRSIFWRVFWKEYRLQRALWIAMAVLTSLMLWLVFEVFSANAQARTEFLFRVAVAFPVLYALGCGATLFAGEREAETYEFHRTLPVGAAWVFAGKSTFAIVSSVAMFGLMWLLAAFLGDWKVSLPMQATLWALFGFFGMEMLLWATFFSLLTKRVLIAAILGATAATVSLLIMVHWFCQNATVDEYAVAILPRRAYVAALVALADLWLGTCWFRQQGERRLRSARSVHILMWATALVDRLCVPEHRAILGRLVWQHWRQSKWTMVAIGTLLLPVAVVFVGALIRPQMFQAGHNPFFQNPVVFLALMTFPLLGLCAFMSDQRRNSYRFLADRGVPPKYVWLSRQVITLVLPAILAAGLFLILPPLLLEQSKNAWTSWQMWLGIVVFLAHALIWVMLSIAAGQFCSMFIRSGFLAGVFSLLMTSFLWGWCTLMMFWGVNWLWSVLPIPVALLLATRLRTPYWLLERNDLRAWLAPVLALVVPTVAVLTAVALYRAYQIPLVDPGFSPEEYTQPVTAEEKATLDLYKQAIQKLTPEKVEGVRKAEDVWMSVPIAPRVRELIWADANQKAIELALKASRGKLSYAAGDPLEQRGIVELARLLLCSAASLDRKGKLDAALDCYSAAIRISLHLRDLNSADDASRVEMSVYAHLSAWATHPGQTAERIVAAVRKLQQLTSNVSAINGIKLAYLRMQRAIEGDPDAMAAENFAEPGFVTFWLSLPWEREQALRLLNMQTRAQLTVVSRMEKAVRKGEWSFSGLSPYEYGPSNHPWHGYISYPSHSWLGIVIYGVPNAYDFLLRDRNIKLDYAIQETSRRAIQLILALEAWKLQHGSLPKTLDELVGPCLDRLPVDPCSGEPFRYFREGIPGPLPPAKFEWPYVNVTTSSRDMAPHSPFFWSIGLDIRRVSQSGDILGQYELRDGFAQMRTGRVGAWDKPNSTYGLWINGWPFPIP